MSAVVRGRQLLVMRHAKAAGQHADSRDFDRPLMPRGRKDALKAGQFMRARGWLPERVLCSPAVRTRETLAIVLEVLEAGRVDDERLVYDERLYNAPVETLLELIRESPPRLERVLLVGHNPALDHLVDRLSADPAPRNEAGKLMTTGTLALLETDQTWADLGVGGARLAELVRP